MVLNLNSNNFRKCLVLVGSFLVLSISSTFSAAADDKLKPLEVETIHLYVKPSAVAKADSAFATKHFKRVGEDGAIRRKARVGIFKNRPRFKYVRGFIRINNGPERKVDWRYRGLLGDHWRYAFPYKSIKIKILDDNDDLAFRILNLNHIETDPLLRDVIGHEIYHLYGSITPRMKLVRFYVNDQYSGFKVLVENIDDYFLKERGLPKGNVYRENTSAEIGVKSVSGVNYFKYWWKKKTLRKQKNWDDWIHLNHVLAFGRQDAGEYLLDREYYVEWLALGLWISVRHMNNHNLYLYHNLENQKWYSIPWDMTTDIFGAVPDTRLLEAPNKVYASILINPHSYHERNKRAWQMLNDDAFFKKMADAKDEAYEKYIDEIQYCLNYSDVCEQAPFESVNLQEIRKLKKKISSLIKKKREQLKSLLLEPPAIEVSSDGRTLDIQGVSSTGFKIKKNGWLLTEYENLTLLKESESEVSFLINVADPLLRKEEFIFLEPKTFHIKLTKDGPDSNLPQITSWFSKQYGPLVINDDE